MHTAFEAKKAKILEQLATPDQDYTDLSPKGSVDEGIRDLVRDINNLDGFVTTSSCAGRVAVYLEGQSKRKNHDHDHHPDLGDREEAPDGIASGGKGGGQWLYVSHDPVSLPDEGHQGATLAMLGMSEASMGQCPQDVVGVRFIHLKYEPFILHVLHASLPLAQQTLSAALSAGFRESGIASISPDNQVLVAVRTAGLAFDSIIGYADPNNQTHLMVEGFYLRTLLQVANERFVTNAERKDRFWKGLLAKVRGKTEHGREDWEPAEERRERKRAEGLRRKAELETQRRAEANEGGAEDEDGMMDVPMGN